MSNWRCCIVNYQLVFTKYLTKRTGHYLKKILIVLLTMLAVLYVFPFTGLVMTIGILYLYLGTKPDIIWFFYYLLSDLFIIIGLVIYTDRKKIRAFFKRNYGIIQEETLHERNSINTCSKCQSKTNKEDQFCSNCGIEL